MRRPYDVLINALFVVFYNVLNSCRHRNAINLIKPAADILLINYRRAEVFKCVKYGRKTRNFRKKKIYIPAHNWYHHRRVFIINDDYDEY